MNKDIFEKIVKCSFCKHYIYIDEYSVHVWYCFKPWNESSDEDSEKEIDEIENKKEIDEIENKKDDIEKEVDNIENKKDDIEKEDDIENKKEVDNIENKKDDIQIEKEIDHIQTEKEIDHIEKEEFKKSKEITDNIISEIKSNISWFDYIKSFFV